MSNYTDEQVAVLEAEYTGKDNATEVAALAEKLGKSQASVRSKLSTMGKYVKAETAKSSQRERKEDLADRC